MISHGYKVVSPIMDMEMIEEKREGNIAVHKIRVFPRESAMAKGIFRSPMFPSEEEIGCLIPKAQADMMAKRPWELTVFYHVGTWVFGTNMSAFTSLSDARVFLGLNGNEFWKIFEADLRDATPVDGDEPRTVLCSGIKLVSEVK